MTIKEYRLNAELTQKSFAERLGLSLRTLQDYEQGRYEAPGFLLTICDCLFPLPKKQRDVRFSSPFPVRIKETFLNVSSIHPLQQAKVASLIKEAKEDPNIERVIIFGSSVTEACHLGSDIDIYLEKKEERPFHFSPRDYEIDPWDNFMVDERLKKEIMTKGVIVYEQSNG